ncbi:Phosphate acetyltransferase, partial [Tetrabaena socialis]
PLVVTSADRLDIVLGLLAAQLSVTGPGVAGVLLTQAGSARAGRNYARDAIDKIFSGLAGGGLYKGALLPVLLTELPIKEALLAISRMDAAILPSSTRKITQCKVGAVGAVGAVEVVGAVGRMGAAILPSSTRKITQCKVGAVGAVGAVEVVGAVGRMGAAILPSSTRKITQCKVGAVGAVGAVEVVGAVGRMGAAILPSSTRKITQCKGLLKPVNDLSRGCTVPDIVNTICVTSIQAMQVKQHTAAAAAAAAPAAA